MNSGRENCSAMASASIMWVSVQKKQALPTAPVAPRTKCMPGRLVRSGSNGSRQKHREHQKEADQRPEEEDLHRRQALAEVLHQRRHDAPASAIRAIPARSRAVRRPSPPSGRGGGVERQLSRRSAGGCVRSFIMFVHSREPGAVGSIYSTRGRWHRVAYQPCGAGQPRKHRTASQTCMIAAE